MIDSVKNMVSNIKDILGYGEMVEKRDIDIVAVAEKIEAILEEIKNVFKSEEKRGVIVDHAKKVQAMVDRVKDMLSNIKDILGYGGTPVKRDIDIVKVAEKIEAILEEIKNVFKSEEKRGTIVDHAKKLQDMIDSVKNMVSNIKDILGYGEMVEKRDIDIVAVAEKIEAILEEIKNVFKSEEKRGVIVDHAKKVQAMVDRVKDMLSNIKDILGYGGTPVKRDVDIVKVAEKIEAIIEEVKKFANTEAGKGAIKGFIDAFNPSGHTGFSG